MRIRAKVRNLTGTTKHVLAVPSLDGLDVIKLRGPKTVEIAEQDGAFYLLRLDGSNQCIADTWHETEEAAKAQAKFEFDVEEKDWKTV